MERHAQKDREAGGEGLGILVTRKRCWRDEDGRITTKRPASSAAALARAQARRSAESSNRSCSASDSDRSRSELPEPHGQHDCTARWSTRSISPGAVPSRSTPERRTSRPPIVPGHPSPVLPTQGVIAAEALLNQPPPGRIGDVLACQTDFEELFSVDTASSFNMPVTTLSNYNWLFNEQRAPHLHPHQQSLGVDFGQQMAMEQHISYDERPVLATPMNEYIPFEIPLSIGNVQEPKTPEWGGRKHPSAHDLSQRLAEEAIHMQQRQHQPHDLYGQQHCEDPEPFAVPPRQSPLAATVPETRRQSSSSLQPSLRYDQSRQHTPPTVYSTESQLLPVCSQSTPYADIMPLPKIDEIARRDVIDLIVKAAAGTTFPISRNDPLLSLGALQNYW